MTAFWRSGDSVSAVPAPSENISANFFRAERDDDSASFPTARKRIQPLSVQTHGKKPRLYGIPDRAKKYNSCLSKHTEKTEIARHNDCAEKIQLLRLVQRGAEDDRAARKSRFQAKKRGKGQIIYRIFCRCDGKWSYDVRASRRRGRGVRRAKKIRGWGRRRGSRNRCRGLRFDFVDRGQEQSQCVRRWRRVKRERKAG